MGREVRRVPASWQHPIGNGGQYVPLLSGSYKQDVAEWDIGHEKWQQGLYR